MKKVMKFVGGVVSVTLVTLAVFWFSRPTDVQLEEVKAPIPHQAYSHVAAVDGVRLHYQEKGNGPALILIHGYGSSVYMWKDVFNAFAERFHVIAVDLKGFGFSEKPAGDYTVSLDAGSRPAPHQTTNAHRVGRRRRNHSFEVWATDSS